MFETTEAQNYYDILDVKPDATQSEIRQAYFRVKSAYSRDSAALYSLFDEQETQLVLERMEQAYLVLSNPEKRKEYDKVHGLLGAKITVFETKNEEANIFSFANTAQQADAAFDAAKTVLGANSSSMDDDLFSEKIPAKPTAASVRDDFMEMKSTPMSSGPRIDPEVQKEELRNYDNKLGIIRRLEIVKGTAKDDPLMSEIESQTEFRGTFFKTVRESRGISIDELGEFTKINKSYLLCIEAEEFESLPAAVYVRGFISQIAKALKIPQDKVTAGYMAHYKKTFLK